MKKNSGPSMTNQIRKGLKEKGISSRSIVAFVIFGMIVLVFVLSDLNGQSGSGSMSMGQAAEVNGEIISIKDFQDEENRLSQYYAQLFGGQFDMSAQRDMLRGEVMNSLVSKTLSAQAAEKEGIFATDAEVRYMVTQELPYFKRDGAFQSDAYKSILASNRMTPGEFENKLRQDIKNQRSRQLFETSMAVSDLQRNAEKELRAAKMNIEFIALNPTEFSKTHEVNQATVQAQLAEPEFTKRVDEYFKNNQAEFEKLEEIKASHILIKSDATNEAAARDKATAILQRLQKEDFAKVAAQVSDDPGSKAKNGDLGYFSRGRMVKEFEEEAFKLPVGQVSGLVKSSFGFHIIKVTDKKPAVPADVEKSKQIIAKRLIGTDEFGTFVTSLEKEVAAGNTDVVNQTLAKNNLKWKETGFFDIAAEAVPAINSPQVMKASLELSKSQPVAKKLVREGDTQYLVRLKDAKTEMTELKPQDQEVIERQKSTEAYRSWVETFKKSAKIETNADLTQATAAAQ